MVWTLFNFVCRAPFSRIHGVPFFPFFLNCRSSFQFPQAVSFDHLSPNDRRLPLVCDGTCMCLSVLSKRSLPRPATLCRTSTTHSSLRGWGGRPIERAAPLVFSQTHGQQFFPLPALPRWRSAVPRFPRSAASPATSYTDFSFSSSLST